jgi:NCAIR mutase (PurE)-related protein
MTSLSPALLDLMSRVIHGEASGEELMRQIESLRAEVTAAAAPQRAVEGATVDLDRQSRCGFGEVIYGEGKSAELVTRIIRTQLEAGQSAFVTRIDSGAAFQVRQSFEFAYHNPLAKTLRVTPTSSATHPPLNVEQASSRFHAAVVTAGSTDAPVAEEAMETLNWMGIPIQRFEDIGVAGPQRLAAALPALRLASAVVVVAGMEGALPAVMAGHLQTPIFAVPTSVGYGANLGGLTTLMSMLSTCAASVAVVNIDSGFKGGYMAGMVVRQLEQVSQRSIDSSTSESKPDELSEPAHESLSGKVESSAAKAGA